MLLFHIPFLRREGRQSTERSCYARWRHPRQTVDALKFNPHSVMSIFSFYELRQNVVPWKSFYCVELRASIIDKFKLSNTSFTPDANWFGCGACHGPNEVKMVRQRYQNPITTIFSVATGAFSQYYFYSKLITRQWRPSVPSLSFLLLLLPPSVASQPFPQQRARRSLSPNGLALQLSPVLPRPAMVPPVCTWEVKPSSVFSPLPFMEPRSFWELTSWTKSEERPSHFTVNTSGNFANGLEHTIWERSWSRRPRLMEMF